MKTITIILRREDYLCGICHDLCVNLVFTPCGHRFCKACICPRLPIPCPACRSTVSSVYRDLEKTELMKEHFAEEPTICNTCGTEHSYSGVYRCIQEAKEKKKEEEKQAEKVTIQQAEHAAQNAQAATTSHANSWWSVMTSRLRQPNRESNQQLRAPEIAYIYSEEHHVWHMSNENPMDVIARQAPPPPPPITPLPASNVVKSTRRYVDHLNITVNK